MLAFAASITFKIARNRNRNRNRTAKDGSINRRASTYQHLRLQGG